VALPTSSDLKNFSYASQGQPFVDIPAKASIALANMGYAFQGQPFVRNPGPSVNTTNFFQFL
jgi:hypothetical protein